MANKPFGCTAEGIQIAGNPSNLYNIDLVTGGLTLRGEVDPPSVYNAIGYNNIDGNIYGMLGNKVVILNNDQTVDFLADVPNLPTQSYIAGDIDLAGRYYIYSVNESETIYVIDANPNSPTYLKLIDPVTGTEQTQEPFGIKTTAAFYADWAFSPIDNQLYAAISNSDTVARINPLTGEQTILNTTGLPSAVSPLPTYGAAFADASGALYFINNGTGNVYRVVITGDTAEATLFSRAQPAGAIDGARCALAALDALSVEKIVDKARACAGSALKYTIKVTNLSLSTLSGVKIIDALPDGVTLISDSLELDGNPVSGDLGSGIEVGSLEPGADAVLTFSVTTSSELPAQNPIVNTAQAMFDTGTPVESGEAQTLIVQNPRHQAISDFLQSIALEQTAISHILNAEGEKIQKILTLENVTAEQMISVNKSAENLIDGLAKLEMVLAEKAKKCQNTICEDCADSAQ